MRACFAVLCVWCVALCRHAGQEEVVVGSPYHGRDAAGTEGLIGYFVNMLALRLVGVPSRVSDEGLRAAIGCVAGAAAQPALRAHALVRGLAARVECK